MHRRYTTTIVAVEIEPGMMGSGPLLVAGILDWYQEDEADGFATIVADTTDEQHGQMVALAGVQYLGPKDGHEPEEDEEA